jgi:hypothetical protein
MPVETSSFFAEVIQDHLALRERNQELEPAMPLDRYKTADPFENHPLFKTEEQARLEETMDGVQSDVAAHVQSAPARPDEKDAAPNGAEDTLWGRSRDFDWGD